jgi:glycosyltransferase involved in cell wall biosynthesis
VSYKALSPFSTEIAAEKFKARKRILWVHGRNVLKKKNNKFFERIYRKFDKIFCVSQDTKQEFCATFPSCKEKTEVFCNLIDVENILQNSMAFTPEEMMSEKHINICTVGRLAQIKGQGMVPKTVRLLLDAGYQIHWYLVGDGNFREQIMEECRTYHVEDHVYLLGTKENPYPYMKACDIYVQPSYSEGYCTTTVEAKILCKPVVTTPAPGMNEQFVSGENGLIVDAMTPEALFEGIRTLIDHPELRDKFVENLKGEVCNNSGELEKLYAFIEGEF